MRVIVFLLNFFILSYSMPFGLSASEDSDSNSLPYLLNTGDVIDVSVWRDEALTQRLIVRPDGMISFPLIGEIKAAGKSVDAVREQVEEKIKRYVPDKPVTVILREIRFPKIYVIGKVKRSGAISLNGDPLTVLQALSMAGGLDLFADSDEISIVRELDGVQKIFQFDYCDVSRGKKLEQNLRLQPGDTIIVP